MQGDIAETSVAELCRGLAEAGSSGIVVVVGSRGTGRIGLQVGAITAAESPVPRARLGERLVNAGLVEPDALARMLEDQQSAPHDQRHLIGAMLVDAGLVDAEVVRVFVQEQILDALLEITGWTEGTYRFEAGRLPDVDLPVALPVDRMLVEVSRRHREWDGIRSRIVDVDAVPVPTRTGAAAAAPLEPDERLLLSSIDGARSIRDLARDLGYGEFEAARIVYGLTLLGAVQVRTESDAESDAAGDGRDGPETFIVGADGGASGGLFGGSGPGAPPAPADDDVDDEEFAALLETLASGDDRTTADAAQTAATMSEQAQAADEAGHREPSPGNPESSPAVGRWDEDDRDVSALLRELSRLSAPDPEAAASDEEPEPPSRPRPRTRPEPPDEKGRGRGLFGRGR